MLAFNRIYESDELENNISSIVKQNTFRDALEENNNYEYHYYLSYLRENLFSWYPFKENGSLLEIGAGYGQLTNVFCKNLEKVTAVESNESKASIIKERVKENNLRVLVNDFGNLEIDQKFDYIILCDIFEYAKSFYDSKNPYEDYLNYLKNFLTDDGVILIAISNRLGLKYFAGFPEEHTGEYFTGIDNFPFIEDVQTFSHNELETLIKNAGFENYKFFYPYPDHIFPKIINTDAFANKIPFGSKTEIINKRANFFKEYKLNQVLANDGLAEYFSNSFLVEIRNSDDYYPTDGMEFIKINSQRSEEFRTITLIEKEENSDEDLIVSKIPFNSKSRNHIHNMHDNSDKKFGKIGFLENEMDGDKFSYPYIESKSLENNFIDAILADDKDGFFRLLEEYYDALFYDSFETNEYATVQFVNIFKVNSTKKFHCHEITNLDVIFNNIFIIDGEYVSIDYEWLFDFPIPLEYIFYRVVHHHLKSNPVFKDFITLTEIYEHFELDKNDTVLFQKWERSFLKYVYGNILRPKGRIIPKNYLDRLDSMQDFETMIVESPQLSDDQIEKIKDDLYTIQNKRVEQLERLVFMQNTEIETMVNSSSWKITKPLRALGIPLKAIKNKIKR